ncbi:MAG: HlyD family efflux transporter periplasmic adaptor subunit [Verrucomicrobiota bacterium]|nr:HlyD family efflux transporter periplasmic adaptor subunit [Verrucomicrobiota bacterium]
MKLRRIIVFLVAVLVLLAAGNYIRLSMKRAAAPLMPSKTPSLDGAPARVYGLVEPLEREVFVGPLQARRVIEVAVKEGDEVAAGAVLCRLDDDLEKQAVAVARSRLEEAVRRLELTRDDLRRKRSLAAQEVLAESELSSIELQAHYEEQQIETASAELALRQAELEKLVLRSPVAGIVYKMDVRLGEHLTPQDYQRIVVGRPEKQVRLFVETFWLGRIRIGDRFVVRETEALQEVGTGIVSAISPYVGARDFRTEDRLERLDTKYGQVILRLDSASSLPINLQVVCEKQPAEGR